MITKIIKITFLTLIAVIFVLPIFVHAQNNGSIPVATTLEIAGAQQEGGEVIVYDESLNEYSISSVETDSRVYGVTALRPALVFTTGSGTVPVVSLGTAQVQVTNANGQIRRGDLLTTSAVKGVAMRAELSDTAVFAVALEDFGIAYTSNETGSIAADVGVEQVKAMQNSRREIENNNSITGTSTASSSMQERIVSMTRAVVAIVIAVGGLLFIMYSFRSTIAKGVVSIGRNPRARISIMALAVGNIIFALILCAVVVFIAIGILILPI